MNQPAPQLTSSATHPGWRLALPALVCTLALLLVLFRETALAMAGIWARSDTYAHGFIVPPIVLWLIWRQRSSLAPLAPGYSFPALLLFAGAGFAWLLGEVAAANVVSQFALIFLLVLAVPVVLGWEIARALAFPLLFLFFAVPFGDFAMPKLMDWTAQVTIFGLRLSGVPVHAEGLRFVIPTGSWSVVEACSGVRYLIASVTVGTLFAYLTYHSLVKRVVFVGVSVLVPIVANWARAYMIVMLGHLSGNKLAVGVDHLIYGWVFFGIVIMAMFWIGARWREDELPRAAPSPSLAGGPTSSSRSLVAAAVTVVVGAVWPLADWQIETHPAAPLGRPAPLEPIAGWSAAPDGLVGWRPKIENPAASTQENLQNGGRVAGIFLAYYRNQDQQHKLVSSANVLVTSEDPAWTMTAGGARDISFDEQVVRIRQAELRGFDGRRITVWQWYWVNGRWTANDALAKVYTALSRLTGKGDDSAMIILYAVHDQNADGQAVLEDLARAAAPVITSALRQTMAAR
ncbi:exosortase A [Accumulibacter sp.]|uniref:exosortase A n=1 Tax=Accumulibacter sp. TaxID=2053492 RepID=UPI002625FC4F|nr:exosortase A [Accumulibacter sp.]